MILLVENISVDVALRSDFLILSSVYSYLCAQHSGVRFTNLKTLLSLLWTGTRKNSTTREKCDSRCCIKIHAKPAT